MYCSCLYQVVVLGVEDVVDLRGHPLLGNDLLPVRPGVVPVPLPVKPQGQLANLAVSHRVSLRFSRSACQSHGQLDNLTVSLPVSRSARPSHCQLANLTVSLPISRSACQACQSHNLTVRSQEAGQRGSRAGREQAESRPRGRLESRPRGRPRKIWIHSHSTTAVFGIHSHSTSGVFSPHSLVFIGSIKAGKSA